MGFFGDVGDFVSQNVQSAVRDAAHIGQQYVNNPITRTVAPAALGAIGVPPQAYGAISNYQNQILNSLQGQSNSGDGGRQVSSDDDAIKKQIEETNKKKEDLLKQIEQQAKDKKTKRNKIIGIGIISISLVGLILYSVKRK